ncbi:transmembrane protein 198-like [Gadus macrocephalus]|uniref:transmembrane protein 198-like n=1 Tax=Gadus macrocephalus TaxID=80720 RepID=UPI0028CB8A4D|nr:transmembrane protein 198-like [Gadus macrocephalus]
MTLTRDVTAWRSRQVDVPDKRWRHADLTTWAGLTPTWAGGDRGGPRPGGEAELLRPVGAGGVPEPGGRHRVVPSVVCAVGVLFGIVYCFFGYRCFKAVMFLTGLLFGSAVVFLLCVRQPLPDSALGPEAAVGVAVGAGLLCGLVAMLVRSVGLFLVGLLLGLLLALALLVGLEELSSAPPRSVWAPLGLLLGSGTLCAVLTLQWPRLFTTLSTACFGAAAITVAMDYFAELLGLVLYVVERLKAAPRDAPVCWVTWAALGVWGTLAALGVLVQWKVTAEGYSHTKVIISRHQRHMQVLRIRQRDDRGRSARGARAKKKKNPVAAAAGAPGNKASPAEPAYRRKPHPIRRYDGDVLSPSYIQNFRERQVEVEVCGDEPSTSSGPPSLPMMGSGPLNPRPISSGPLNSRPISSGPLSNRPMSSGPLSSRPMSSGPLSSRPMSSGPLSSRPISSGGPLNSRPMSSGPLSNRPMSSSGPHNHPLLGSGPQSSRPISSGPINSRPISSGPINSRPISSGPLSNRPMSSSGPHNSRPTSSSGPHNGPPQGSGPHSGRPTSSGPANARPTSSGGPHFARPPGGPHAAVDLGYDYGSQAEAVGPLLRI